ncbi:Mucin 2, oligomeric mucus/gel-forming [Ceratobasidium theobromae]|uniref:Mucin 2, oligomeric mucus/gel-forming n=1 Tax=Ceratobasidium theobromae TaxID=1582974 RepID=A0A5N5QPE1_9AGAM|nr:Mucin 2, oligomeric mucus/gel-forming [Ceratobasidium theobromae]
MALGIRTHRRRHSARDSPSSTQDAPKTEGIVQLNLNMAVCSSPEIHIKPNPNPGPVLRRIASEAVGLKRTAALPTANGYVARGLPPPPRPQRRRPPPVFVTTLGAPLALAEQSYSPFAAPKTPAPRASSVPPSAGSFGGRSLRSARSYGSHVGSSVYTSDSDGSYDEFELSSEEGEREERPVGRRALRVQVSVEQVAFRDNTPQQRHFGPRWESDDEDRVGVACAGWEDGIKTRATQDEPRGRPRAKPGVASCASVLNTTRMSVSVLETMQRYGWLEHPRPTPASGPIEIVQLEMVARSKPSLKTRSVSDTHRLVAREKSRPAVSPTMPSPLDIPAVAMGRRSVDSAGRRSSRSPLDDRSPLEHAWARAPRAKGRTVARAASQEGSFVFPQISERVPLRVETDLSPAPSAMTLPQFRDERSVASAMQGSPASGVYVSPIPSPHVSDAHLSLLRGLPTTSPIREPMAFPASPSPDPRIARTLSPLPPRLRRTTDAGSASDEVVFRASSSSASSTPQKRKRRRARLPVRANSEGFTARRASDTFALVRTRPGSARVASAELRRTGQALVRTHTNGNDAGEVSSDGRDVVLFVPRAPPPLVRKESIPLPEAVRKPSLELTKPIIEPPPRRTLPFLPWSPPARVFSRPELASREGSFYTAPDSFADDTATDHFRHVSTPIHMDLRDVEEADSMLTAEEDSIPERATISSAMRGHVQPVTLARRMSGEFVRIPSPRQTATVLSGLVQNTGFLVPPSPLPSGSSRHTPHSSSPMSNPNAASIPMRHDQSYSPPRFELPRSVTPRTELSVCSPEDESFHSAHTADPTLRLPLDDWLEFAISSMAAMGIPLTRETLEDLHESEDESLAVLGSISSARRPNSGVILDNVSQADDDSGDNDSSRSLSDVGTTPSPSASMIFSAPGYGATTTFSTDLPGPAGSTRPTIQTCDLEWPADDPADMSAMSDDASESARAVDGLQHVASAIQALNMRTPIPSNGSSRPAPPPVPHQPYVVPPSFVGAPPTRTLSPGAVSISFSEASPAVSSVPPLVVLPADRDRFADSLLLAEYRHSFHYLRDDEYRTLDEGGDVVLYSVGGDWEQVRAGAESRATTDSIVPIEFEDFDPASQDPQARNKYIQFLLSLTGALRTPGPRPQRWVETALRSLRGQMHHGPRYPGDLYDAIGRTEAGVIPPPPEVPNYLGSAFVSSSSSSKSSSLGSALPEDDEILEDFVRSVVTPSLPATPRRRPLAVVTQVPNILPWPALPSPVSARFRIVRPLSRQTAKSQVTALTTITSSNSGYSSLIPPPPRPRSRSVEPHWLAIYMSRRWPVPDTYATRRTYSSPSALCPPMPYHWRPICHISPERLWEITNLAVRIDTMPLAPPPQSLPEHDNAKQHFSTPATTHHSMHSVSSPYSSHRTLSPVATHPGSRMTSHPNLPIHTLSRHSLLSRHSASPLALPPPPPPALSSASHSHSSRARTQRRASPGSSTETGRRTAVVSRVVTPAGMARKRTMKELVGRLMGKERARTRSLTSRAPTPLKSRLGFAGKVADVARRILGRPKRRSRLTSIRSQRDA